MNTAELRQAFATYYAGGAYAVLWEVGNGTGSDCSRHCDALAMSLWPSRGLKLIGAELKVSRSDWLKELKTPAKAESVYQYCDHWFLVVADAKIVQPGELPESWGMMAPGKGGNLRIITPAKDLEPKPVSRSFLAAIMRRVVEQGVDTAALTKQHNDGYKKGFEAGERGSVYEVTRLRECVEKVRAFERASGVAIEHGWQGPTQIGAAVKAVLSGALENNAGLRKARNLASAFVRDVDVVLGPEIAEVTCES